MRKTTVAGHLRQPTKGRDWTRVVQAVDELLAERGELGPLDVLVRLGLLALEDVAAWQRGEMKALETALVRGDRDRVRRILAAVQRYARERRLRATRAALLGIGRCGERLLLRFTRAEEVDIEEALAVRFALGVLAARRAAS